MNEQQFWQLIETVKHAAGADLDARPELLEKQLSLLEPVAIQGFQQRYEALLLEANHWDLWGAASLMNGGCSDDGFRYFRDWLISEGERTFKTALRDPDTLVVFGRRDYFELESYGYAALHAHAARGAGEIERDDAVEFAATAGDEWDEAELPGRFPRLAVMHLL